jgi:hypothetical protein
MATSLDVHPECIVHSALHPRAKTPQRELQNNARAVADCCKRSNVYSVRIIDSHALTYNEAPAILGPRQGQTMVTFFE